MRGVWRGACAGGGERWRHAAAAGDATAVQLEQNLITSIGVHARQDAICRGGALPALQDVFLGGNLAGGEAGGDNAALEEMEAAEASPSDWM
eukprot:4747528-Prymnesium_polylepis.1